MSSMWIHWCISVDIIYCYLKGWFVPFIASLRKVLRVLRNLVNVYSDFCHSSLQADLEKIYSDVESCPRKGTKYNVDSSISNVIIYVHCARERRALHILVVLVWKFMVFYWHSLIILLSCALVHSHKQYAEYKSIRSINP